MKILQFRDRKFDQFQKELEIEESLFNQEYKKASLKTELRKSIFELVEILTGIILYIIGFSLGVYFWGWRFLLIMGPLIMGSNISTIYRSVTRIKRELRGRL